MRWQRSGFRLLELSSRRDGEADWTRFGAKSARTFLDGRPPREPARPEVRLYRAIFVNREDRPVGSWSDVVAVTAKP